MKKKSPRSSSQGKVSMEKRLHLPNPKNPSLASLLLKLATPKYFSILKLVVKMKHRNQKVAVSYLSCSQSMSQKQLRISERYVLERRVLSSTTRAASFTVLLLVS